MSKFIDNSSKLEAIEFAAGKNGLVRGGHRRAPVEIVPAQELVDNDELYDFCARCRGRRCLKGKPGNLIGGHRVVASGRQRLQWCPRQVNGCHMVTKEEKAQHRKALDSRRHRKALDIKRHGDQAEQAPKRKKDEMRKLLPGRGLAWGNVSNDAFINK